MIKKGAFMKLKYILFACVLLTLVLGCARPPIAEMDNARNVVFMAENDPDAVLYGSSSLTRARASLRRMQENADSKRYDAAKVSAAEAIAAAERAIADGRAGAVRAREEAAALLSSLNSEIEETSRNVNGARYSNLDLDYDDLDRGIRNAYNAVDQAEIDQAEGRYQDALDRARGIRSDLSDINQRIADAVTRNK
jgi:hypothetical protein